MNNIVIVGRAASPVELRAGKESNIAIFEIADNYGKSDNRKAIFIECVAFGKSADNLSAYLSKGDMVAVAGRLDQETWQGSDGKNRKKHRVIIENFNLLEKKQKPEKEFDKVFNDKGENTNGPDDFEEDVPF